MPELPEVETTARGISPFVEGRMVSRVDIRQRILRWPIPDELPDLLRRRKVLRLERRGKYLLFRFAHGTLLLHLGMSGSLRIVGEGAGPGKHDHVDFVFKRNLTLRFTDPRRFGAVLWYVGEDGAHRLLRHLGPEPLGATFDGDYLYQRSRCRRVPVKSFLMDGRIVVGVGNIYANEALFLGATRPTRMAGSISRQRYGRLAEAVRSVLGRAIEAGGTTLRDFVGGDGRPGYFKQQLYVYGRAGEPCYNCRKPLREIRLAQRSTVFCPACQR